MIDENKFWELVRQWEYDTKYSSSAAQTLSHPSVTAIIQMGQEAIPLAVKALKENWFMAFVLHKLTNEWPVKDEYKGNQSKIIESWRKWAQKHNYPL
jgi:hypothetical protein